MSIETANNKDEQTCVACVNDFLDDMFVVKLFKVESTEFVLLHGAAFRNVDGWLAFPGAVGIGQAAPLRLRVLWNSRGESYVTALSL